MQRKYSAAIGMSAVGLMAVLATNSPLIAQGNDGPPGPPPGPPRGRPPRERPPRIDGPSVEDLTRVLDLTPEQQKTIQDAIDEAQQKIDAALSEEQRAKLQQMRQRHGPPPPPPPPRDEGPDGDGPEGNGPRDNADGRENAGWRRNEQDEDHGRPVELVARDLGVTPEQFRAAFRKVHPARRGEQPTEEQRRTNRKVLSETLGVSPEKLDEVMDRYRPGGRGDNGPKGPPPAAPPDAPAE